MPASHPKPGRELYRDLLANVEVIISTAKTSAGQAENLMDEDRDLALGLASVGRQLVESVSGKVLNEMMDLASLLDDRDKDWRGFLRDHDELKEIALRRVPQGDSGRRFDDEELFSALRLAIDARTAGFRSVHSSQVADVLYPEIRAKKLRGYERSARVGRVGGRLGKLARTGQVVQLRPTYGAGCCSWSLPGVRLTKDDLRWNEVVRRARKARKGDHDDA